MEVIATEVHAMPSLPLAAPLRATTFAALATLTAALSGCGPTMREQARTAYVRGDYLGAVQLYDKILSSAPTDAEAIVRRTEARDAALRVMAQETRSERGAGKLDAAMGKLARALELRDQWRAVPSPPVAAALADEVTAASSHIDQQVARALTVGPFAAEAESLRHAALLRFGDLTARRERVEAAVRAAGHADCDRLSAMTSPQTPYWTWLVDRACAHWGGTRLTVPVLPHQRSGLEVTGGVIVGETLEVDTANPIATAGFLDAATAAFRDSLWYSPAAPEKLTGLLDGKLVALFSAEKISVSRDWTEQVPYTADEVVSESYQEPYDDTETYTEQVPYTEYQTTQEPCGTTTCTSSTPVTVYRTETKTRTVTRHRTAWRDVTQQVTRYRDEPRVFRYEAIDRKGRYASAIRLRFEAPLKQHVPYMLGNYKDSGVDHDARFAPAGVSPERANLMTLGGFLKQEQERYVTFLRDELAGHYQQRFCSASSYTLDAAAACAFRDPKQAPPPVHAALASALGPDEPFFMRALGR